MTTRVTGVTFTNDDGSSRRAIIEEMSEIDTICLERDPYNQYDSNAVKVCVVKGGRSLQIGYLEKKLASQISPKMRRGTEFSATIVGCGIYNDRPYCEIDIAGI